MRLGFRYPTEIFDVFGDPLDFVDSSVMPCGRPTMATQSRVVRLPIQTTVNSRPSKRRIRLLLN
jgi:hypothetical protein